MTQYEVDKLLESSHLVSSFVGNAYVKMYKRATHKKCSKISNG